MSNVKLNDLTLDVLMNSSWTELLTLEQNMKKVMDSRRNSAKTDVIHQLEQISLMNGFTIDELFGKQVVVSKMTVKYRNTDNINEVWTGRGKTPIWLQKLLDNGRTLAEFVV
jgi:DNA-binding protein H-NS